jgi:hypothetical protein
LKHTATIQRSPRGLHPKTATIQHSPRGLHPKTVDTISGHSRFVFPSKIREKFNLSPKEEVAYAQVIIKLEGL